jgi:hypothetical protein
MKTSPSGQNDAPQNVREGEAVQSKNKPPGVPPWVPQAIGKVNEKGDSLFEWGK